MTHPNQLEGSSRRHSLEEDTSSANTHVSGTKFGDATSTIYGSGSVHIVNNGVFVTVTDYGSDKVTATQNGNGDILINNRCTAAVTVTRNGNGNTYITATGSAAITYTAPRSSL